MQEIGILELELNAEIFTCVKNTKRNFIYFFMLTDLKDIMLFYIEIVSKCYLGILGNKPPVFW